MERALCVRWLLLSIKNVILHKRNATYSIYNL